MPDTAPRQLYQVFHCGELVAGFHADAQSLDELIRDLAKRFDKPPGNGRDLAIWHRGRVVALVHKNGPGPALIRRWEKGANGLPKSDG